MPSGYSLAWDTPWHKRMGAADLDDMPVVQSLLPSWEQFSAEFDLGAAIGWPIDGAPRLGSTATAHQLGVHNRLEAVALANQQGLVRWHHNDGVGGTDA